MVRFLGQQHGYYPSDAKLAYDCDSLVDLYQDLLPKLCAPCYTKDEAAKPALVAEIFEKLLPNFLKQVEPICARGEFLVGDSLTIADFWIGGLYTNFCTNEAVGCAKEQWATALDEFPNFKAYGERFAEANKTYLAARPQYRY